MKNSKKWNILVIEDELALVKAIKTKLENNGLDVTTSRSVSQALGFLDDGVEVDAIWLDHYLLGNENGLDFVTKIKAVDSHWKNIPIFVVSNASGVDTVRPYLMLGVEKYYTKINFRIDQIVEDIKNILNGSKK